MESMTRRSHPLSRQEIMRMPVPIFRKWIMTYSMTVYNLGVDDCKEILHDEFGFGEKRMQRFIRSHGCLWTWWRACEPAYKTTGAEGGAAALFRRRISILKEGMKNEDWNEKTTRISDSAGSEKCPGD